MTLIGINVMTTGLGVLGAVVEHLNRVCHSDIVTV